MIVGGNTRESFTVTTVAGAQGQPSALLELTDVAKTSGTLQHEITLELHDGSRAITRFQVTVTLAGDPFLAAYRQDRLDNAFGQLPEVSLPEAAELLSQLTDTGEFIDLRPTETVPRSDSQTLATEIDRLGKISKAVATDQDTKYSQNDKLRLYAGIERASDKLQIIELATPISDAPQNGNLQATSSETGPTLSLNRQQPLRSQLGQMAILLADDIRADLASSDPALAHGARRLHDTLVASSNFSDLLWKGYGVNSRVLETQDAGPGETRYTAIYEAGQLYLTDQIAVNIGRPAVVEVTKTPLDRYFQEERQAYQGVSAGTPATVTAIADTYIYAASPNTSSGSNSRIYVGNGNLLGTDYDMHGLLKFDVSNFSQYTTGATVTLHPDYWWGSPSTQVAEAIFDHAWDEFSTWNNGRPEYTSSTPVLTTTGAATWTIASGDPTPIGLDVSTVVRKTLRQGDLNFDAIRGAAGVVDDVTAFELAVKDPSAFDVAFATRISDAADVSDRADLDGNGLVNAQDAALFLAVHGFLQGDRDFDGDVDGLGFFEWQQMFGQVATYFEGDVDFSGIVDGGDIDIWSANFGLPTPEPAEDVLSLRVYAPTYSPTEFPYVGYISKDNSDPANADKFPQLSVEQPADVVLTRFDTTFTGQLQVTYSVLNEALNGLSVEIYRTADGNSTLPDELLDTILIATTGDLLQPGLRRKFTFQASVDSGNDNYRLVAKLQAVTGSGTELNQDNNEAPFAGGAFLDSSGTIQVHGTDGDDTITVTAAGSQYTVSTQFGGDYVIPAAGGMANVQVRSHGGADTVSMDEAILGFVLIRGGAGNDTLSGGEGWSLVFGGLGDDRLVAKAPSGSSSTQVLFEGAGDDTFVFGSGNLRSVLIYPEGEGLAAGNDMLDFSGMDAAVDVSLAITDASQTVAANLLSLYLTGSDNFNPTYPGPVNIENVIGTEFGDIITGNGLDNRLEGKGEDDRLIGLSGNDTYIFRGNDSLGTDSIEEGVNDGIDTLDFTGLFLGAGVAVDLRSSATDQQVIVSDGKTVSLDLSSAYELENIAGTYYGDNLHGNELDNDLTGWFGNDLLFGEMGADTLRGGWGIDLLEGGEGDDLLYGESGNDTYQFAGSADLGTDTLFEAIGEGIDSLDFSGLDGPITLDLTSTVPVEVAQGRLWLSSLEGAKLENVIGTELSDQITGNNSANHLHGLGGNDTIRGGDGNDTLDGGTGNDNLYGEGGNDILRGGSGSDYAEGGTGDDTIDLGGDTGDRSPPELENIPQVDVRKDVTRTFRVIAEDGDHNFSELFFSLQGVGGNSVPASASISSVQGGNGSQNGIFRWASFEVDPPGTYQVEVIVTDPDGLSNSQIVTIGEYDYNEGPPKFESYYAWFDESQPDPLVTPPDSWQHSHFSNTGTTGIHHDTIYATLADPGVPQSEFPIPTSTTLNVRVNPYESENASGFNFDTQTSNADLTYRKISGPGSMDASGNYTWNISHTDAGQTHRVVFEVEDNGSPDNGVVRTYQDYLFVKVDLVVPDNNNGITYRDAPLAIDREYIVAIDEPIQAAIFTGPGIGVYNPIFSDDYIGTYRATFTLSGASNGSVTLDDAADGTFTYTPNLGYRGVDSFTYTIEHFAGFPFDPDDNGAWLTSNTGTVTLYVGPHFVTDLDTSLPDEEENNTPGERIVWNTDDDNNNGVEDYLELNGPVAGEDDLVPVTMVPWFREDNYLPDFRVEIHSGPALMWDSPNKGQEIVSQNQFLVSELPEVVYVEKIAGMVPAFVVLRVMPGGVLPGPVGQGSQEQDQVRFEATANLTAYRPTVEPDAISFGLIAVPEDSEEAADRGPGIRINGDDDDGNGVADRTHFGPIVGENDLIRVDIAAVQGQTFVLDIGSQASSLFLWDSPLKGSMPIYVDTNGQTLPLTMTSVFVEWVENSHGTANLELVDLNTGRVQDTLVFHSFQGLVVAISGETAFGGDPVASQGTDEIAIGLINRGYDVQYFDVQTTEPLHGTYPSGRIGGEGAAYELVMDALNYRGVSRIGIFGYSHGGGATYNLSYALANYAATDAPGVIFTIDATAYIDAVRFQEPLPLVPGTYNPFSESRRPINSNNHANYYELNTLVMHGVSVPGSWPDDDLSLFPPPEGFEGDLEITHFNIDELVRQYEWVESFFELRMSIR